MKSRGEIIISSLIIAAALIICISMLKSTRFFDGQLNTSANVGGALTMYDGQGANRQYNEVLTSYDAASYLGMDPTILENAINSGKLGIPYVSTGGQIVFSKKALDEWVYNTSKSSINSKP